MFAMHNRPLIPLPMVLLYVLSLFALVPPQVSAEEPWVSLGDDGQPQVHLYFFWALTCPHCTEAHPYVDAIPRERPWVRLHDLELTRHPDNAQRYRAMATGLGATSASVPALIFCGQLHLGWDRDETTGEMIRQRLDNCRERALFMLPAGPGISHPAQATPAPSLDPTTGSPSPEVTSPPPKVASSPPAMTPSPPDAAIDLPFIGAVDPASLSLPMLALVLAGLDAFNPCAFFVLLFLLSIMVHQHNRNRMLIIGGIFVTISGLMYFAFMAAWLSVFQLLGHLAWVTLAAGLLAVFIGAINVKDFFLFNHGLSLSIPAAKKPDIFRRARAILSADSLPAMAAATAFLAIAANFYELLCTAGFPMVYTRLLTLADLTTAGRLTYLAAYNLIYVLPLGLIVVFFARNLGSRKLTEREGRLLKLLSGIMMLGLGTLLLIAPELISHLGVAFGLMALAFGLTVIAARLTRTRA
jgi:glutaredoxin